jgi:type VI secretion system protein ImpH
VFAAGLLAMQTRPAEAIARLVSLYFAVPAKVREFVGAWLDIPPRALTRLGLPGGSSRLGQDAVVGTRVFHRHHRFRLVLGPLGLAEFLGFLPDGDSRAKLAAMVRRVPGPEMDWDTQLVLRRDEVPGTVLDGTARLGWTSWLLPRKHGHRRDADDVVLLGHGGGSG